ncbi:DNA polymerase IV [Petroclostridium sp. X23]|uniref:DNA polymerase IV n=1 Tax=Petroclostridium sp. X23 TaxID=3045146 RepID=UPI0024AD3582|nr:DNA polymerase IV [Petroclostridium sp. X23]WHH57812.1 DNA polymerase IV [Petroclostridium sp. X23]
MQRVVFLVDMNAFFISCEMTRNPSLVGKPAAVAGDPKKRTGIILAANYEARKFGVKTAMTLHAALKLCPDMLLVPPDHEFYNQKSNEVMNLLSGYTPIVEQNSIDEAWLDMTGTEYLFGKPVEAAARIMNEIRDHLGLWCSIGIAENKFLAKMASEMKKPLGITELWQKDIPLKLWPLPIKAMYGIGSKTAEKLNRLGIQTIGELAKYNREQVVKALGKCGLEVHLHANGHDPSPLQPHTSGDMKSIGRSTTLSEDITDIKKAKLILMDLADDVGMTARKHHKKGRTIQITLKYSDFQVITRQTTIPVTCATREIFQTGCSLLEQNWNTLYPVRLIGISLSGFDEDYSTDQLSLFDFVQVEDKNTKQQQIDLAMDKIRNKHGIDKINRAALIKRTL